MLRIARGGASVKGRIYFAAGLLRRAAEGIMGGNMAAAMKPQ